MDEMDDIVSTLYLEHLPLTTALGVYERFRDLYERKHHPVNQDYIMAKTFKRYLRLNYKIGV